MIPPVFAQLTDYGKPDGWLEQEVRRCSGHVIIGIDEAGRGPLAGPVVAAAVRFTGKIPSGLTDSKLLSEKKRKALFAEITGNADIAVMLGSLGDIERLNIRGATLKAMTQAGLRLKNGSSQMTLGANSPIFCIDGRDVPPDLAPMACAIIKGDRQVASISAASIIAKVIRDNVMAAIDRQDPRYGFAQHKGYGTAQHLTALAQFGPCRFHRAEFRPVRELMANSTL